MNQYCRYCTYAVLVDENMIYCTEKKTTRGGDKIKRINHCKSFDLNELDVFDIGKTYKPREPKPESPYEQLSL